MTKPRRAAPSEQEFQRSVILYLRQKYKAFCWKAASTGLFDVKRQIFRKKSGVEIRGVSDVLCLYRGVFFAFEVKRPEQTIRASREQKQFILDVLENAGGGGFVSHLKHIDIIFELYFQEKYEVLKQMVLAAKER